MPWLGKPTSYASGYIRAHRTSAASQSLTTEFSSPPTYWTGLRTSGSSGSSWGYTDGTGIVTAYRCCRRVSRGVGGGPASGGAPPAWRDGPAFPTIQVIHAG